MHISNAPQPIAIINIDKEFMTDQIWFLDAHDTRGMTRRYFRGKSTPQGRISSPIIWVGLEPSRVAYLYSRRINAKWDRPKASGFLQRNILIR